MEITYKIQIGSIWIEFKLNRANGNAKGQLISKANCQAVNSSKKRTNEFVFKNLEFGRKWRLQKGISKLSDFITGKKV